MAAKKSDIIAYNRTVRSTDADYKKMTWGRYQGYFIREIPNDYLLWLAEHHDQAAIRQWATDILIKRTKR